MRYRKPEELKEADLEWIGGMPINWSLTKVKRGYRVQLGKMLQSDQKKESETKERYLRAANITWQGVDFSDVKKMWFSPEEKQKYKLKDYDLLVTEGGDVGRSAMFFNNTSESYYFQNALNRVRGRNENLTTFLFYWIYTLKHSGYIDLICGKSTIAHLTAERLERLPLLLPPFLEQRAIAAFLDRKTEAIDAIIQKKEQLIERLKEKRQALITQAVTKGLDPNVPMKDSGIEWLGEIPEEWKVTFFKREYNVQLGKMLQKNRGAEEETFEYYLRAANIQWNKVNLDSLKKMWFDPKEKKKFNLKIGDLLVSEGGDVGRSTIWQGELKECYFQNAINRVRALNNNENKFAYYWIYFLKHVGYIDMICSKSTISHLTAEKLEALPLLLPPVKKQEEIIKKLDDNFRKAKRISSQISNQIDKLKEYRQSLISAAVTGKIDVRDEVEFEEKKQNNQTANIYFKRRVLAAKILDELHAEPTMGRRKLQKIVYLLEKEIEAVELKGSYQKDAAGPFDNKMMRSIESQLEKAEWFKKAERENGYGFKYIPMIKKEEYKEYYDRYWSSINDEIEGLIELVRAVKTDLLSLVATLYACWNDFLIKGEEFNGKKLIYESRHNWHEEKKKIPESKWKYALNWMGDNGLKPEGEGELTREKS